MADVACEIDGIAFPVKPKTSRKLKGNDAFWMDRQGKIYNVYTDEHDGHWDWAVAHGLHDGYNPLEKRGWLHVSSWRIYYYPDGRMKWTKAQIDKIEKWLNMNQEELSGLYGGPTSLVDYMAEKPEWF